MLHIEKKTSILTIVCILVCICVFFVKNVNIHTNKEKKNVAKIEIPRIYLEGDISDMTDKKDERVIFLKYRNSNLQFDKYAKIKIQGSSSIAYEKKNYTIKLYDDEECNNKYRVQFEDNWGKQFKYCLKANWIDKTHARNIVSARIAGKIQRKYGLFEDAPNNGLIEGFPVEVYINNEFLGLYTLNIPKDAWLWNMDKDNVNHTIIQGEIYTSQTRFEEELIYFGSSGWGMEIGDDTIEGKKRITEKLNELINFVQNSTDEEFVENFEQYFDKDAALNYLIGLYLFDATDNYAKNLILVTYDGDLWYLNLYDLDTTFGTTASGGKNSYKWLPETRSNRLLNRIIECMPNELADRWFELRKDIITKENILNEFNMFINSIPEETFQREQERWQNIPGYGIEQIEEFLDFRLPYIDNLMYEYQQKVIN